MLTEKQYLQMREELQSCKNPLFFYDDDPDGLSSFLLCYRFVKEGHGIVVKTHPKLTAQLAPKVTEYGSDKAFVLDVALLEQDFIDACPVPVVWIDHHGPYDRHNVKLFNPRVNDPDIYHPTSFLCYQATKQDLWIATVGCVADMFLPPFYKEFKKKYPHLAPKKATVREWYFNSKLGELVKVFSFCLKGQTSDVRKLVKVLTRIEEPDDILEQRTPAGKFIYQYYFKINRMYTALLDEAMKQSHDSKLLVYTYSDDKMSFTSDLSNELLYKFPNKIILVGRRKGDDVRMSIRSGRKKIPPLLEKAMVGLEGYGGGHEKACGASIKHYHFNEFVDKLRKLI